MANPFDAFEGHITDCFRASFGFGGSSEPTEARGRREAANFTISGADTVYHNLEPDTGGLDDILPAEAFSVS